jgi:hypothetical protein
VSPDPPWRLLGGLGRRKYRPPPRGSQAQETAGTAGTLRQRLASPGGLGGGGHPRRRREAPPMASPPRAPSGAVTSPPRRRDRPHRGYVSPSSAQPRGARTSGGRGGGAGPGRARSGRRALRLSRLPLTRPGVRPRRLRSGPDKSSPARVRVRPPGSPCPAGWRGPLSRPAALGSPSGPASIDAARTGGVGRPRVPRARVPGRSLAGRRRGGICETVPWRDYTSAARISQALQQKVSRATSNGAGETRARPGRAGLVERGGLVRPRG